MRPHGFDLAERGQKVSAPAVHVFRESAALLPESALGLRALDDQTRRY
jgi:hypothetical protein